MKLKKILIPLSLVLLAAGCQSNEGQKETTKANVETTASAKEKASPKDNHQIYDIDVKDRPVLGDKNAKNTIILAFDYSCPWCKKWFKNVMPKIEKEFIDNGKAKFVSQPLAILNQDSLFMTKVDRFVELKNPSKYYEVQRGFESRTNDDEVDWATEEFILSTLEAAGIKTTIEAVNKVDNNGFEITSEYTENYGVESVPTVYINGAKLNDPFDIDKMKSLLNS
ncbi:DsbA family protein [Rummeliibacillus stabekisii]|uniref:DsbA family protein n=1 Tax=Rummeliibacillus stabekisii TaxID=241244 RepID=UPI00203F08CF|nr:DsbA family protein [Rummeliibacillus stabekisii]MCM3317952.1 DsbA family protein [Rummeliibacillus stabekisii]